MGKLKAGCLRDGQNACPLGLDSHRHIGVLLGVCWKENHACPCSFSLKKKEEPEGKIYFSLKWWLEAYQQRDVF